MYYQILANTETGAASLYRFLHASTRMRDVPSRIAKDARETTVMKPARAFAVKMLHEVRKTRILNGAVRAERQSTGAWAAFPVTYDPAKQEHGETRQDLATVRVLRAADVTGHMNVPGFIVVTPERMYYALSDEDYANAPNGIRGIR